jgi:hypothetical protein
MGGVIQVGDQGQPQPTITLTLSSTLRQIKDKGNVLYGRINAQDYEECQDDIQAVSGIADDIQDAVLDYQVRCDEAHEAVVSLKLGCFDRWHSNERCMNRIVN